MREKNILICHTQRFPDHIPAEAAAEDADVTLRLARVFEPRLREAGLEDVYRDIDHPVLPVLAEMEAHGIAVDPAVLATMSKRT